MNGPQGEGTALQVASPAPRGCGAAVAHRLGVRDEPDRLNAGYLRGAEVMEPVEIEDVVGRRLDALLLVHQEQGLEHVDQLGNVRHEELVRVIVEDVER